jgi:hypothetical protein
VLACSIIDMSPKFICNKNRYNLCFGTDLTIACTLKLNCVNESSCNSQFCVLFILFYFFFAVLKRAKF